MLKTLSVVLTIFNTANDTTNEVVKQVHTYESCVQFENVLNSPDSFFNQTLKDNGLELVETSCDQV